MQNPLRFQSDYGIPSDRSPIAKRPLDHLYQVERVLDTGGRRPDAVGFLNNGVFLVRNINSGKQCVQKCIPADKSMSFMLEREILLLHVLQHLNIVRYVDACITDTIPRQMTLYVEYYNVGGLDKMMKRFMDHGKSVPEAFVWHVLHSLASALQYLHFGIERKDRRDPPPLPSPADWPPILHCDIKPDNILMRTFPGTLALCRDASYSSVYPHWPFNVDDPAGSSKVYPLVALADFGMATQWHEPDFYDPNGFNGILKFSPPEPHVYSSGRGDVWALGATVLSLCRLLPNGPIASPPPHYPDPRGWYEDPERRRHLDKMGPGEGYSKLLKQVLGDCLTFPYEHRVNSWQLMGEVRKAEKLLFSSPGKGLKVRLLPEWAYGKTS